jgi:hypothetical protein
MTFALVYLASVASVAAFILACYWLAGMCADYFDISQGD